MLTFLERSTANVLGVKASGKLTRADYQQMVPRLEQLIQEHGRVRVLFELEDCQGWEIAAAWDDLKFYLKHGGDVERCAIVGDRKWQEWMSKLSRAFLHLRYFNPGDLEQAWQWIQADENPLKRRVSILGGLSTCQHG
jgi:hypothetical protein